MNRRPAASEDLDEWAVLAVQCLGVGWEQRVLTSALADPATRTRIAEQASGRLVGFVLARRVVELLEIDGVGVAPDLRKGGIARALLEDLIETERRAGATEVRLELRDSNVAARALYAGLGFVVVGRRARYYPDGEDAVLWTRRLEGSGTPEAPLED